MTLPEINLEILAHEKVLEHWREYFEKEYDENHEGLEEYIRDMNEILGGLYLAQQEALENVEAINGNQ